MRRRRRRQRRFAIVGACAVAGVLLGAGGGSLALWADAGVGTGSIRSGYELFAAGRIGQTTPAVDHTAAVTIGTAEARTLLKEKKIAIAVQTDSLSQGNKGLRYEVAEPEWSGVFGAADVRVFPVAAADKCTVDADPGPRPGTLESVSVPAEYSDTTTPTVEYWCVRAVLPNEGSIGTYTNTATVSAEDSKQTVTSTDRWTARVSLGIDPEAEPDHRIRFTYETFRPGGQR